MDLKVLQARLRDPDQWVRVEALRILAMVDEVRALRDIEWVFKNDPEPGVRQVAQWAGQIVYAAYKQQQQQRAAGAEVDRQREERLLNSLVDTSPATYQAMQAQLLQRELSDALRAESNPKTKPTESGEFPALPEAAALSAPPARDTQQDMKQVTIQADDRPDMLDLLDAGLSDEFFED